MNRVDYQYFKSLSVADSLDEIIQIEVEWMRAKGGPVPDNPIQVCTRWGLERLIQIENQDKLDANSVSKDWSKLIAIAEREDA